MAYENLEQAVLRISISFRTYIDRNVVWRKGDTRLLHLFLLCLLQSDRNLTKELLQKFRF